ncbi:MAG: MFS transporter [Stagnimonas sp.]|nr:MFS transporter [Stagnimonas sp.]
MNASFTAAQGWRYGLLGLPLAFAALPLYVLLPNHYAREFGVPLAALGALLLASRLLDAFLDPWLGRVVDRLFARSAVAVLRLGAASAACLALGFALLFFPPVREPRALLAWAALALVLTYVAYSALTIAHQAWGAMLGGDPVQRSRVVAWRETFGLCGVLIASALPLVAGFPATAVALGLALALGWAAWRSGLRPAAMTHARPPGWTGPWQQPAFRRLLAVFVLNGVASAVPATLVLFFVQDRLQAPAAMQPLFLGSYFLAAALAIPLWLRLVPRLGLERTWIAGMFTAIAAFAGAAALGPGDGYAFLAICIASGAALGTDLALPAALLAGTVRAGGHAGGGEGAYFGWWNFASKLNLALAAGLALPLLALAGYVPGTRDPGALQALTAAYTLLPCVLKAAAALLLYSLVRRHGDST